MNNGQLHQCINLGHTSLLCDYLSHYVYVRRIHVKKKKSKKEIDVEMLRRKLRHKRGQQEKKTQFFKNRKKKNLDVSICLRMVDNTHIYFLRSFHSSGLTQTIRWTIGKI